MARFIHSVIVQNQLIAADGIATYDLPVNPLSALLLHISPLNETSTITNFGLIARILSALDNVQILHKGTSIIAASGADLFAHNILFNGLDIAQANPVQTDNDRRSFTLPLIFGRRAYDPKEGIPETQRGELVGQFTWDIADTGFDGLRISIEAVELPDATPDFMARVTTLGSTIPATGDFDLALPIGHEIRGLTLFGTTAFAGATPAPTLGRLTTLVDNLQTHYSTTDFEVSRAITRLALKRMSAWNEHLHGFVDAAAGQANTQRQNDLFPSLENYTVLDFDPLGDDSYNLQTKGAGAVTLRINAETADAMRCLVVQKFPAASLDL